MTNTKISAQIMALVGVAAIGLALMTLPSVTNAATYAYVDATGEVKSVTAADWMTAIATAPNIHIHSGVLLLDSAADFDIVGDEVPSV